MSLAKQMTDEGLQKNAERLIRHILLQSYLKSKLVSLNFSAYSLRKFFAEFNNSWVFIRSRMGFYVILDLFLEFISALNAFYKNDAGFYDLSANFVRRGANSAFKNILGGMMQGYASEGLFSVKMVQQDSQCTGVVMSQSNSVSQALDVSGFFHCVTQERKVLHTTPQ